jgi:hypothetical protein
MRYSLAGGYQSNAENTTGLDYCVKSFDGYSTLGNVKDKLREWTASIMGSPDHRRTVVDKWYRKVNIGLAWDRYNLWIVHHFEGDYVEHDSPPAIKNGIPSMSGRTRNDVTFYGDMDLSVTVFYDPPPHPLTRGQLSRT